MYLILPGTRILPANVAQENFEADVLLRAIKARRCGAFVSDAETNTPKREPVWQTEPVTFGRIIIGWRVGT